MHTNLVATGSTLTPSVEPYKTRALTRTFCLKIRFDQWLHLAGYSLIQKNINKELVLGALEDLLLDAKTAFDSAHGQGARGAPTRTPEKVDIAGLTVLDLNAADFNVRLTAIRSTFMNSSSGKQASDNGTTKEQMSDRSLGDVTRFSSDQQRSFTKSISDMRTAMARQPGQVEMNTLYGYAVGTAFRGVALKMAYEFHQKQKQLKFETQLYNQISSRIEYDDLDDVDFNDLISKFSPSPRGGGQDEFEEIEK